LPQPPHPTNQGPRRQSAQPDPAADGEETKDAEERRIRRGTYRLARIQICITSMGIIAALAGACFALKALETGRRTLVANERPWLMVSNPTAAPLINPPAQASLILQPDGMRVRIVYTWSNFGKSPAVGVSGRLKIHLLGFAPDGHTNTAEARASAAQESDCKSAGGMTDFSPTVFPNAPSMTAPFEFSATRADLDTGILGISRPGSLHGFLITGCFVYSYYADGRLFHSYVATFVAKRGDGTAQFFDLNAHEEVLPTDLEVWDYPTG